jgi:hypothetical protein
MRGDISGASGIDFNYGAAPDLQLTATLPAGFDRPAAGGTSIGLSNIELAAKYRFLHQDSFGLDVSVFPRVFLPSPSKNVGNDRASLLLPVWVQKDWSGGWSAFGGGGCAISGRSSQNFCLMGGVVTYQMVPKLQLGVELFHQTADGNGTLRRQASDWAHDTTSMTPTIYWGTSGEVFKTLTRPINILGTLRSSLHFEMFAPIRGCKCFAAKRSP